VTAPGVTVLAGAVDHHVHLGLVDRSLLADGPLVKVIDCGWDPEQALAWRAAPPTGVELLVAGPFHTAPGGYPSGRSWAPAGAVCEIADAGEAELAAERAAKAGYDAFKIALHDGMPLLDGVVLAVLIEAAHSNGLRVFVHPEGDGQAMRAVRAGADVLVHSPWTERLTDTELHECVAAGVVWISTLAIHSGADRLRAVDNARRFVALGGTLLYGTDMGNGDTPVGVSALELTLLEAAGLGGDQLLKSVLVGEARLKAPLPVPRTADELTTWLKESCRA
jgi:imidazolonepropionase-like amidohydrolase